MMDMRWRMAGIVLMSGAWLAGSACSRAQARTPPVETPALDAPAPPPRVIAPADVPLAAEPTAEVVAEDNMPPGQTRRAPTGRPPQPRAEPARAAEPAQPKVEPRAETRPAEPTLQLRTPQSGSEVEENRRVREIIQRAEARLSRVDYAALNNDARTNYDTAKRFIQQAAEALKGKNFVFARYLADKAETLARQLSGR